MAGQLRPLAAGEHCTPHRRLGADVFVEQLNPINAEVHRTAGQDMFWLAEEMCRSLGSEGH